PTPVSVAKDIEDKPLVTPMPTIRPIAVRETTPPALSAQGAFAFDLQTKTVLYSHNPDVPLMPASTTKIMTALIALEAYDLNQVVTIAEEERTIGQTMNLIRGEQIT